MAIEVGNVFEGRVTGVKPFGAFVALPEGRVGMVHISEVSNEFVQDIAAVLHDGDTVKVQVINVAPDGKIALSIKRLLPPPRRLLVSWSRSAIFSSLWLLKRLIMSSKLRLSLLAGALGCQTRGAASRAGPRPPWGRPP